MGDVFHLFADAASGIEVQIPDPRVVGARAAARAGTATPSSYERAASVSRRRLLHIWPRRFLDWMDARLQRDRKRLHDDHHALLRESDKKKARGHAQSDPEKIEATKRAVDLELRRKLGELDERYAMEQTLRPVVLVRMEVPVLAVDLSVFRKQWHKFTRSLEPASEAVRATLLQWLWRRRLRRGLHQRHRGTAVPQAQRPGRQVRELPVPTTNPVLVPHQGLGHLIPDIFGSRIALFSRQPAATYAAGIDRSAAVSSTQPFSAWHPNPPTVVPVTIVRQSQDCPADNRGESLIKRTCDGF